MKKIKVTDITLKSICQNSGATLLFREKTAIAKCADSLGVESIELAPIKNITEDTIIIKTIAANLTHAIVALPVGFTKEEVDTAWNAVKDLKNPRLQVELPVSTLQMEYTYHIKEEPMLAKINELISYAYKLCNDVEFCAKDATRADEEFLIMAAKVADASGANFITLCDDAGISTPEEIAALTKKVKAAITRPVYVQVSDKINMGVASALAAISAGAAGVKCAMAGKNHLITGEFSDAMQACSGKIGAETELNHTIIHSGVKDMLAYVNRAHSHAESQTHSEEITLTAESTLAEVTEAAQILGYDLSETDCGNVYKALMHVCQKKRFVGAKELEALIANYAMQVPSTYHFESYTSTSSNCAKAMAQITLKWEGEPIFGVSVGEGPIDASFRAIENCVGYHYELDDFQIHSVTEGKEALGSCVVRLRNNGKLYSGTGVSEDIVAASIRAYVNALNKIVYEEGQR